MKKSEWTLALKLHRCKPDSLPISRLAEYLLEFSGLLGKGADARFAGIVTGSAVLRARIPNEYEAPVVDSLRSVIADEAPKDLLGRVSRIDSMMQQDGIYGEVISSTGAVILPFPGVKKAPDPVAEEISVTQEGELTGVVTRIGGRDDTVPLLLEDVDGSFYEANIKGRELAKEIGRHLYGAPIRVYGTGTWKCESGGAWKLEKFIVQSYEELDVRPINEILADLRDVPGNGWSTLEDPLNEWRTIRGH